MIRKSTHFLLIPIIIALGTCQDHSNFVEIASANPGPVSPIDFDLDSIIKRGSLRVIIDNSSTGYFIYKGQPMGFEYDLLDLFSREIGVTLDFHLTINLPNTFDLLNQGEGDIIAYSLTVTKERKNRVSFTQSHIQARQILVQRKPQNWRDLKLHELAKQLIRNPLELIGKSVHVKPTSSYADRLGDLSEEIGDLVKENNQNKEFVLESMYLFANASDGISSEEQSAINDLSKRLNLEY